MKHQIKADSKEKSVKLEISTGQSLESTQNRKTEIAMQKGEIGEFKGEKKKIKLPTDKKLVNVADYIPKLYVDLKYATKDNFTGKRIYDFKKAYLRYGTVKKLAEVQKKLEKKKLSLCIWDAYRPVRAQFRLWDICPNSTYVANPNTGYSSHSRGNTVDITLVTLTGKRIPMPTEFDDFTKKADRDYSDCSQEEAKNVKLLESYMEKAGFKGYSKEWWHFSDKVSYPVKKEVAGME